MSLIAFQLHYVTQNNSKFNTTTTAVSGKTKRSLQLHRDVQIVE